MKFFSYSCCAVLVAVILWGEISTRVSKTTGTNIKGSNIEANRTKGLDTLDFGTVYVGEQASREWNIRNDRSVPLTIKHVQVSCSCLQVKVTDYKIEPGTESRIVFKVRPTDARKRMASAFIMTDDAESPVRECNIKWQGSADITLHPVRVFFSRETQKNNRDRKVNLKGSGIADVTIESVSQPAIDCIAITLPVDKRRQSFQITAVDCEHRGARNDLLEVSLSVGTNLNRIFLVSVELE